MQVMMGRLHMKVDLYEREGVKRRRRVSAVNEVLKGGIKGRQQAVGVPDESCRAGGTGCGRGREEVDEA